MFPPTIKKALIRRYKYEHAHTFGFRLYRLCKMTLSWCVCTCVNRPVCSVFPSVCVCVCVVNGVYIVRESGPRPCPLPLLALRTGRSPTQPPRGRTAWRAFWHSPQKGVSPHLIQSFFFVVVIVTNSKVKPKSTDTIETPSNTHRHSVQTLLCVFHRKKYRLQFQVSFTHFLLI